MQYYGLKMGQNSERGHQISTQNKLDLAFTILNHSAKFHQNRIIIAAVGVMTD